METLQSILSVCGAISIIGGAGAVLWHLIAPAWRLTKRIEELEAGDKKVLERLNTVEEIQKVQSRCLAAMLDYMITGKGVEHMNDIKDDLLTSIIDK